MYKQEKRDPALLGKTRTWLTVSAGAAALASLALPWYPLSCWLFAAALALLGVGAFLARRQDPDLNRGWKFAIAAILAHGASPAVVAWQDGALRLLAVLVDVVLLYLSVTLAVTGLVRGGGAGGQPPPAGGDL